MTGVGGIWNQGTRGGLRVTGVEWGRRRPAGAHAAA